MRTYLTILDQITFMTETRPTLQHEANFIYIPTYVLKYLYLKFLGHKKLKRKFHKPFYAQLRINCVPHSLTTGYAKLTFIECDLNAIIIRVIHITFDRAWLTGWWASYVTVLKPRQNLFSR